MMGNTTSIALDKPTTTLSFSSTVPTNPPPSQPGSVWWLVPPVSAFTTAQPAVGDVVPLNMNQYVWVPLNSNDIQVNQQAGLSSDAQTYRLTFQSGQALLLGSSNIDLTALPPVGGSIPFGWIYLVVPASSNAVLNVPTRFIFTSNGTTARTIPGIVGASNNFNRIATNTPIVNPNSTPVIPASSSETFEVTPNQVIWHIHTPSTNLTVTGQSSNGEPVLRLSQLVSSQNGSQRLAQGTNQRSWWA